MKHLFDRTRSLDLVMVAPLVLLAGVLMNAQVGVPLAPDPASGMINDSNSAWLYLFVATPLPLLCWRRNVLAVAGAITALVVVHDVVFGHVVRCGSGLPLTFVVAFLVGLQARGRNLVLGFALVAVLNLSILIVDSAVGPELLPITLLIALGLMGLGYLAQSRTTMARELEAHNEELQRLRDQNAALEVSDDRARLSAQLDELLDQHLGELTTIADAGLDSDPDAARARLAVLEDRSRETLGRMRDIVGTLRGGEEALSPAPSVTQLGALLSKECVDNARLTVEGDPRVLPPSVELSAYRIVEHLLTVLTRDTSVEVEMRFCDHSLELTIRGLVTRGADVQAAVARARERARLQEGTLEIRISRGQARALAHIPVRV